MISIRLFLLVTALLMPEVSSFSLAPGRAQLTTKTVLVTSSRCLTTRKMAEEEEEGSESPPKPVPEAPTPPPEILSTPSAPIPTKRLDPLVASLTRNDAPQGTDPNSPKTKIPLLGEVTLDKNLFIVLPIAAFAVLGFFSFLLVAANSGDEFVDALSEWNDALVNPPAPEPLAPGECRGLCSSQEQDIEGLRNFMNGLAK